MTRRWILTGLVLVSTGMAAGAWLQRDWLTARYVTYRLANAADADVAPWIDQAAAASPLVESRIWEMLGSADATACLRAEAVLERRYENDRRGELIARLTAERERLSPAAQAWALEMAASGNAVNPAATLPLIQLGLRHEAGKARACAIQLASHTGQSDEPRIAALINDPDPEVRQSVILALGAHRNALSDDDLLPRLHDEDRTVQRLARTALLSRGLTEQQVRMGKLLTDPQPASRLQLVTMLRDDDELDLSQWLRRLSRDPSPAVRAAAVRTAAELQVFQLADRIAEMVASDPDAAVRPIALFHLRQFNGRIPAGYEAPAKQSP